MNTTNPLNKYLTEKDLKFFLGDIEIKRPAHFQFDLGEVKGEIYVPHDAELERRKQFWQKRKKL